jgi:hypothetical protein
MASYSYTCLSNGRGAQDLNLSLAARLVPLVPGQICGAQREEMDIDILGGGTHIALAPRRRKNRSGV